MTLSTLTEINALARRRAEQMDGIASILDHEGHLKFDARATPAGRSSSA